MLLNQIVSNLEVNDPSVDHLCLHVQTSNEDALRFYLLNSFYIETCIEGYYEQNPGVIPPDAYFLRRNLKKWSYGNRPHGPPYTNNGMRYGNGHDITLARAAES